MRGRAVEALGGFELLEPAALPGVCGALEERARVVALTLSSVYTALSACSSTPALSQPVYRCSYWFTARSMEWQKVESPVT